MSKILITGGAGFIGSHLVDRLIREGNDIIVLDNLSTGKKEFIQHNVDNPKFARSPRVHMRKILSVNALDYSKNFSWDKAAQEFMKILEKDGI